MQQNKIMQNTAPTWVHNRYYRWYWLCGKLNYISTWWKLLSLFHECSSTYFGYRCVNWCHLLGLSLPDYLLFWQLRFYTVDLIQCLLGSLRHTHYPNIGLCRMVRNSKRNHIFQNVIFILVSLFGFWFSLCLTISCVASNCVILPLSDRSNTQYFYKSINFVL